VASKFVNASVAADLLTDVELAMDAALTALAYGQPNANGTEGCAQGHCNFYTLPLMLALKTFIANPGLTTPARMDKWCAARRSASCRLRWRC
jgi:hypothetical protein